MSILETIAQAYHFRLQKPPTRLSGGLLHQMYKLETAQGNYAVKLLNPNIMQRASAMDNYAMAEKLERLLEQHKLPILPALSLNGQKMQCLEGQSFYLFDYYDGKALQRNEVTETHCLEMGKALSRIHQIDSKRSEEPLPEITINWDAELAALQNSREDLYRLINENYALIMESQSKGNAARKQLPPLSAICHNDMDCKNVLWKGKEYRIIDLECLSYRHPMMELFETALCWSGYEAGSIDFRLFQAFIRGYASAGGMLPENWELLYDGNNGRLEWLAYNLKRALGMDCSDEETAIGLAQVKETIRQIVSYHALREDILKNCLSAV